MSDSTVAAAVQSVVLSCNLTPHTTTTLQANPGDTTVTVASTARFLPDQRLTFADTKGEESYRIASKTSTVLTLDFTGTGYTGLQFEHDSSTAVYSNLQTAAPMEIASQIAGGDPFIFVWVRSEDTIWRAMRLTGSTYAVRVQYHRLLSRPADQQMDANLWAERQETAARTDLEAIEAALLAGVTLGGQVITLGQPNNANAPVITKRWEKLVQSLDSQMIVGAIDVYAQDRLRGVSSP